MSVDDAQIHEWMENPVRPGGGEFLSDEEIQKLLMALVSANPEVTEDDAYRFINYAVRQMVGEALISMVMKGVLLPVINEVRTGNDDLFSFTPHPDVVDQLGWEER